MGVEEEYEEAFFRYVNHFLLRMDHSFFPKAMLVATARGCEKLIRNGYD